MTTIDDLDLLIAAAEVAARSTGSRDIVLIKKFDNLGNYLAKFATPPKGYLEPLYMVAIEEAEAWARRNKHE